MDLSWSSKTRKRARKRLKGVPEAAPNPAQIRAHSRAETARSVILLYAVLRANSSNSLSRMAFAGFGTAG
jgi:hypothetical protein